MACLEKKAIGDEEYQDTERTKRFLVIILLVFGSVLLFLRPYRW